jgi:ribonuclease BN (tRNA processing enzyme)
MITSKNTAAYWGLVLLCIAPCFSCVSDRSTEMEKETVKPVEIPLPVRQHSTRIVLLGTGTPVPNPVRSGPSIAVVVGDRSYIVDFGPGVVRRAAEAHLNGVWQLEVSRLTLAFVTHLHSDHTAGYSDIILTPAVVGRREPLHVYGPPGLNKMTSNILAAYEEDFAVRANGSVQMANRGDRVVPHEITAGTIYRDDNVVVSAFRVQHGSWNHAYGYRFDTEDRSIVISGDTRPTVTTIEACNGCDVLIHEVYCRRGFLAGTKKWQHYHSTHHTSTLELAQLANEARPSLLILYHVLFFGCSDDELVNEMKSQYKGRFVLGNDLEIH